MANATETYAENFLSTQETRYPKPRCGEPVFWGMNEAISAVVEHLLSNDGPLDSEHCVRLPNDPYILQRVMDAMHERVIAECGGQA